MQSEATYTQTVGITIWRRRRKS